MGWSGLAREARLYKWVSSTQPICNWSQILELGRGRVGHGPACPFMFHF